MGAQRKGNSTSRWTNQAVQVRSQQTLERILDATERLMTTRPFRDISVADIALEAKASPTSLYARFENKQALLGAIFERHAASQRDMVEQLFAPDVWRDVALATTLRQTFPLIVAGYRAKQGLIRGFLEQASEDARFREEWSELGDFIRERIARIVMTRSFEISHPNPERGIQLGLETVFAAIALRILKHEIDSPQMEELTEELIRMMLRYMGIADCPAPDR